MLVAPEKNDTKKKQNNQYIYIFVILKISDSIQMNIIIAKKHILHWVAEVSALMEYHHHDH